MRRVWIRRGRGEEVEDGRKEVVGRWGSGLAGRHDDFQCFADDLFCFRLRALTGILSPLLCDDGLMDAKASSKQLMLAYWLELSTPSETWSVRHSWPGGGVWQ